MKATLLDRRHRREGLDRWRSAFGLGACPHLEEGLSGPAPGCVDTSGQMSGPRGGGGGGEGKGPRLRIPDWKKWWAGTLSYPQTEDRPVPVYW